MIIKEMNKAIPQFNADIGEEFDSKSIQLKKTNSKLTWAFITSLFLGALFVDLNLSGNVPLFLGVVFTGVALLLYIIRSRRKLNEQWTYTRVVAESIKSEWFKFIVGGGDYPCNKTIGDEYYTDLFEKNIQEKISEYRSNIINSGGSPIEFDLKQFKLKLNSTTLDHRNYAFEDRLEFYKEKRIKDQLRWYEKKSLLMEKKEQQYKISFGVVVAIGLLVGAYKLTGLPIISFLDNSDWFSIAIALGFALESANSIFQHERLSINYKKSANDLSESLNKINDTDNDVRSDENVFSEFVEDVENRISNEHKSWSLTTNTKNLPNF